MPRFTFLRGMAALVLISVTAPVTPFAQTPAAPAVPAARPGDVSTVDSLISALYQSISGGVGEKRDWQRLYSLFAPGARMIPVGRGPNGIVARAMTPLEYVERSAAIIEQNGFSEKEIARRTEAFGNIVHVWSTYEGRFAAPDAPPPPRGINSLQLYNDGQRWWILSIIWEAERPDNPLPAKYLQAVPPA